MRFPESWSSTSLANKRCSRTAQENYALDNAFALIEGHPAQSGERRTNTRLQRGETRTRQTSSLLCVGELLEEIDDLGFSPMAVVSVARGEEGAVSTVLRFSEADIGIGENPGPGFGQDADEGIVGGVKNERGRRNAVDDVGGRGAGVVVDSAVESAVVGSDAVVEIAEAENALETGGVKDAGKVAGFRLQAAAKFPDEVELVKAVGGLVQGVGGGGEVDCGAHGSDGAKLRRRFPTPFAGAFEDEIASHRESGESEARNVLLLDKRSGDSGDIAGQT